MIRRKCNINLSMQWLLFLAIIMVLLVSASPAFCEVDKPDDAGPDEEQELQKVELKPYALTSVHTGYRFATPDGPFAAAAPYGSFKSGAMLGFNVASIGSDLKLSADGVFFSEEDYATELELDYSGYYRLHLEGWSLWRNIVAESLPPSSASYTTHQDDRGGLGTRVSITQADNRIRIGNNPIHVNLGYWQLVRDGAEQLRFADYYFGGNNTTNHIYSQNKTVNNTTREGSIGLDGHLEWLNFAYGFLVRDFANDAADNRFPFASSLNGALITGSQQAHDVISDSRLTSHTFKLYTDMSGGLVGSAAYTLTQRENRGGHGDGVPSSRPEDTIHNIAGDISYSPYKELSFALKYRRQEIDRDSPASISYPYSRIPTSGTIPGVYYDTNGNLLPNGTLRVRPSTDSVKDTLILSSIVRPYPSLIYRFEYKAELESRENVWPLRSQADQNVANNSDNRLTHTGKVSFYWKPAKGLKLDAFYSYAACDNPAYVASFSERHSGKLLLTYLNNGKWGATASYLNQYETGEANGAAKARESANSSANTSIWFSPVERLTLTTSYSFLHSNTKQPIIFSNQSPDSLSATSYDSVAHVYGIDASYAVNEQLDLALAFQQVRSNARFDVQDVSYTVAPTTYTTSGITDLTRLDSTETGVSARVDWRFTEMFGSSLDYGFRLYDSGNPLYDGSVHTTTLSFKARW